MMTVKTKLDVRKLPDIGGGPDRAALNALRRSGKLREYASHDALMQARKKRKATPAYLLPEDHYRKRKRRNITLSPHAIAIAKKIAAGNVSGGIEIALRHWHDCPRTDRRRIK